MKSILYVGATLMIGASIYGFVNYQQTSKKKEFTNMYKETQPTEPVKTVSTTITDTKVTDAKNVTEKTVEAKKTETVSTNAPASDEKKTVKKKKRHFEPRLFSRGALDERYIKEEKILVEPAKEKAEPVKSENKEQ